MVINVFCHVRRYFISVAFVFFYCHLAHAKDTLSMRTIEEAFALSTLISDSDALTFGFTNFELGYVLDDPNLGNKESIQLKNSLDVLVVPYRWALAPISQSWDHAIKVRAFYINITRQNQIIPDVTDSLQEYTLGLYSSYEQQYQFSSNWYGAAAMGLHLSYYNNRYQYGHAFPDEIKVELDKSLLNVSSFAAIVEPEIGFGYKKMQQWGAWRAHHRSHYIYGQGFGGTVVDPSSVTPRGWRFTNGVELTIDVPELWGINDFLSIDLKRIDLIGDLHRVASNGHYYETTFGWVIDTKNKIPLLDNIGIGISINYGSSVSGGTLVLYYNE